MSEGKKNLYTPKALEKHHIYPKIHLCYIHYNEIRQFIPRGVSFEKTADYIKKALEFYQQNRPKGSKTKFN